MPKNKPVVSQSRTMWVKKGQKLSDGSVAKKGYLAQYGKDTKKVTARVQMAQQTGGVAKGDIQVYKAGKRRTPMMKPEADKPKAPAARPKAPAAKPQGATTNRPASRPTPAAKPTPKRPASMSAAEREKMSKGRKNWSDGARREGSAARPQGATPRVSGSVAAKQPRQKPAGRRTPKIDVAAYKAKRKVRQTRRNVGTAASRVPANARKFLSDIWFQ